jgi:uncharacterized protein (DUF433 family)
MTTRRLTYKDRIVTDPGILVGKPVIRGTRISVELILEYLSRNPNLDEFFADYPDLTIADVQAALAYAHALVRDAFADGRR